MEPGQGHERLCLGTDRVPIEKAVEPRRGKAARAVPRSEQRAGDGRVRVGVTTQRNDPPESRLGVAVPHERLERHTGGE